jgi:hypothetical protein
LKLADIPKLNTIGVSKGQASQEVIKKLEGRGTIGPPIYVQVADGSEYVVGDNW